LAAARPVVRLMGTEAALDKSFSEERIDFAEKIAAECILT
jgi:hypothetical protein